VIYLIVVIILNWILGIMGIAGRCALGAFFYPI